MKHIPHRVAVLALGALATSATAQTPNCNQTYSTDADFALGVSLNVNNAGPNNNQIQLNVGTASLPFVNVACSARGTIVRIDVNTGTVLGEYLTAPNFMGRDPSRTTVDQAGNVWVSNRAESGFLNGQARGSVTRVGLVIGGTRGDKTPATGAFTPNPTGEYLQGPFLYSTCVDRDGDGLIRTSRGLGNILAWSNAGNADSAGGVSTADDECIINYTRITGAAARTVAIDSNNDVWTGGLNDQDHEKLDGVTGQPIAGSQFNLGAGGYGGLVDQNGILWSARGGSGLLRYDTATNTGTVLGNGCGDYGLGVDPNTGEIWHTQLFGNIAKISPAGACLNIFGHGSGTAQGCAVDANGNVWVAHALFSASTVGHLRTDGTFVGNVSLSLGNLIGNGPTGVAVDANGKVWVTCYNTNHAMRIDPNAGALGGGGFPIGAVDMIVDLGAGASPYNYSDMTGFVNATTSPTGSWTVVKDSGVNGQAWGTVSWSSQEPSGTSISVEVRAANSAAGLAQASFIQVGNGQSLCGGNLAGRFLETRATLTRSPNSSVSPVLLDLTVACCSSATLTCPPDFTAIWAGGVAAGQTLPATTGTATFSSSCGQGGATLSYQDVSIVTNTPQNPHAPEAVITRVWTLTDNCGANERCTQIITLLSPAGQAGALTLDVNPGSCPNNVAVNSPGSTKITLVGTWLHNLNGNVDRASLVLRRTDGVGMPLRLENLPYQTQDITRPYYGPAGGCNTSGPEAYSDATVTVPNWMLRRALDLGSLPVGTLVNVSLTGQLSNGTPINVTDVLRVQ
jgi:streptogramin lyase